MLLPMVPLPFDVLLVVLGMVLFMLLEPDIELLCMLPLVLPPVIQAPAAPVSAKDARAAIVIFIIRLSPISITLSFITTGRATMNAPAR